jgi:Domain of unknown function (DUF397)
VSEREPSVRWRKSSASGSGDCLEWAFVSSGVWLRNSRDPGGPELHLRHSEWEAFVAGVKNGEADLPDA